MFLGVFCLVVRFWRGGGLFFDGLVWVLLFCVLVWFFVVAMRREERAEYTLSGFACGSFSCLRSAGSCQYQPKWKNGFSQDVMKIKHKQVGLGGKGDLAL